MIMSDRDIKKAIDTKELVITNFSVECLQPASYDMRAGKEAFSSTRKKRINLEKEGFVAISPGDLILLSTYESVETSRKIAGHIGLRSSHARLGLVSLNGPQIDPGFRGTLTIGLCNLNSNSIKLKYKEPFCTVEFMKLLSQANNSYNGPFQDQYGIRPEDSKHIEAREVAWSPIEKRIGTMEKQIRRRVPVVGAGAFLSLGIVLGGFALILTGILTTHHYTVIPGIAAIVLETMRYSMRTVST